MVPWTVNSGDCSIDGECLTSPNYPATYGSSEYCSITVDEGYWVGKTIQANIFSTEGCCDKLTINGEEYAGALAPDGVTPSNSPMITWSSDGSTSRPGWSICPRDMPAYAPTAAPAPEKLDVPVSAAVADSAEDGGGVIIIVIVVIIVAVLLPAAGCVYVMFCWKAGRKSLRVHPAKPDKVELELEGVEKEVTMEKEHARSLVVEIGGDNTHSMKYAGEYENKPYYRKVYWPPWNGTCYIEAYYLYWKWGYWHHSGAQEVCPCCVCQSLEYMLPLQDTYVGYQSPATEAAVPPTGMWMAAPCWARRSRYTITVAHK